jgi:class 3 adenylate cyclase/tetratricopeptide (TPR) repeat protein
MPACANCGTANPSGKKFCTECGTPLALACPSCGAEIAGTERFCGECGNPLPEGPGLAAATGVVTPAQPAAPAPAQSATERRLVSVLFADLVGFTSLSESRDAEEVRELLSRYFDTCRRLVGLYGGVVEKFIGDAVMAVWGTPVATEDDAERAVRTALDLVAAVQSLGQEVGAEGLRARAGVMTGEAAVNMAAVGEGMVAGDLVNTASRVQSVAEPGSVFVGEATRRATEGTVVYESAGSFELKGKEGETPLWCALRVVSGRAGSLKSEGLEAPFVGRDRELRQIKDLFHVCAEEGRAQLVSVTGIAGIGKSRLAWEFYKYFDGIAQSVYWHRGRCLAYGEGVTYWALADMVRWRCGIAEDDPQEDVLQKLQAALEEHLLDPEERRFVEPRLGQLLALGESASHERQDLFAAWRLFFERLADTYPTILAFEDMQWADSSLLDFVEYLLEWSRDKPLFVVTMARPELLEKRPNWGAAHRNFTSMYLEPLSEQAMQELLVGLVPGLPPSLRNQILERAEGIPLYAVETVRMLLDRGLLVEDGSAYQVVGEVDTLEVPETLHALIAARLDGLSVEERLLIGDAAVLGKTFTPHALAALSGLEDEPLEQLLTAVVRREVLGLQSDPRSPEQGQYTFLQDLLRHVAYETLPKRERREKHLAAAAHLSATLGEDEVIEVIASHYVAAYEAQVDAADAAEVKARAREALARAGRHARSLAAAAEARRYFEQAAGLVDAELERAELLAEAGEMAGFAGDGESAWRLMNEAIAIYQAAGDAHAGARVTVRLGLVAGMGPRRDDVGPMLERAFDVLSTDEPDEDLAALAVSLSAFYWFSGESERAAERGEFALDLAEAGGYTDVIVRALGRKVFVAEERGHPHEALALAEHALKLAREHALWDDTFRICIGLSDRCFTRDRYADALVYLEEGLEAGRKLGNRLGEWSALAEMTYPAFMLGRWDEVLRARDELTQEQVESAAVVLSVLQAGLSVYIQRGELDEASRLYEMFLRLERSTDIQERGVWLAATAALRRAQGQEGAALAAGLAALELAPNLGLGFQSVKHAMVDALESARVLGDEAKLNELLEAIETVPAGLRSPFLDANAHRFRAHLEGDNPGADRQFSTAAAQLRALELPFHLAVVQLEYAEWLLARGRPDDAQPLIAEARGAFEQLDAKPWLERLDAARASTSAEPVA